MDSGDAEIKRSMLLDNSMASMTYDRAKKAAEPARKPGAIHRMKSVSRSRPRRAVTA